MDECEALCQRLAVMVRGEFKCCGYVPALKSKYGEGFIIMVKCDKTNKEESLLDVNEAMMAEFSPCSLQDEYFVCIFIGMAGRSTPDWYYRDT